MWPLEELLSFSVPHRRRGEPQNPWATQCRGLDLEGPWPGNSDETPVVHPKILEF